MNVVIRSVHKTRAAAEKKARKIWGAYVIHHPETARTREQFLVAEHAAGCHCFDCTPAPVSR